MSSLLTRRASLFLLAATAAGCAAQAPSWAIDTKKTALPKPTPPKEPPAPQLEVELSPSRKVVLADNQADLHVRLRVRGLPLVGQKRGPINLSLVIDTSGSMEGQAMERARASCVRLVDLLGDDDALSIVSFGTRPKVALPATRLSKEARKKALEAIAKLSAEGTTDMAGGLRFGIDQVRQLFRADGINRIVLVGDGVPNDPSFVDGMSNEAKQIGAPITTLGLGADFDMTLMTTLAERSGGTFHFVDDAARVAKVFEDQIAKMQRLVARATSVELTPGPGVTVLNVLGIPSQSVGRVVRFGLGDLSEGQVREAIVRVSVKALHDGAKVELLDARAHYTHAVEGVALDQDGFVAITVDDDTKAVAEARAIDVEHQAARLRVAEGIVHAIALARNGEVKQARSFLDELAKFATAAATEFSDAEFLERAKEAKSLRKTVASLAPPPPAPAPSVASFSSPPKAMKPTPSPPPLAPAAALEVRKSHGRAMQEIQGL